MAPHDAFGRPIGETSVPSSEPPTGDARARAEAHARASARKKQTPAAAEPAPGGDRSAPSAGASAVARRGRGAVRLLATVVLLAGGGVAIAATMRSAVDAANDDQRVADLALRKDPLGPRSFLRTTPLRKALARLRDEADRGERVSGVSVSPERVLVTLVDPQDQQRWLSVSTTGALRSTGVGSSGTSDRGAPLSALTSVDPAPATRFLARKYAQLQPHAREPSLSLIVTTSTSTSTTVSSLAGIPPRTGGARTRYLYRWSVSFEGVRQADRNWLLGRDGRVDR